MSAFFSMNGVLFLLRWLHIFAGVLWIGLLYYFNFVQGSFMKEAAAPAKPEVLGKLLPRAMWWFRWAAFWTMVLGIVIIGLDMHNGDTFVTSWGITIGTGGLMGLVMGYNVWFVINPAQNIVIANAQAGAAGQPAVPGAAEAGPRALLASRTNVLLSIPMLFFMAGSRHLILPVSSETNTMPYWIAALVILVAIEINALKGKLGPIETIKGVVTGGFILTAVYAVLMSVLL
jgi:uncharacterized membrane protein